MLRKELEGKTQEELIALVLEQASAITTKDGLIQEKQNELDLTLKINEDLTLQIEELSNAAPAVRPSEPTSLVSKETFNVGKKKFGFKKIRMDFNGQIITAVEVLASKELQKNLAAIGSGMIYFIEDAK
jgi:hypothetical protein